MKRLTVAKIRSLKTPGRYGDGDTLYLVVSPRGSKSWVQRLTVYGERRDIGLGSFRHVPLAKAREKAFENRRIAREGGNPLAKRRGHIPTFEEATARTFEGLRRKWRNAKHEATWLQMLQKYAFPAFGRKPVDRITRRDVLGVVEPLWGVKQETARRVRARVRKVLSWSQAHDYIDINVAGEVIDGALEDMPATQSNMRALPYAEMAQVLQLLRGGRGSDAAKLCFRFTVLTAARGNESRLATWSEIDFEERLWCLPPQRMKANKEHRQPLSAPALEVLDQARSLDDGSGLVFPSAQNRGKPLSNVAMMVLLKRNDLRERMTVHGCRASFRTWADECTDADFAAKELSLAHQVGTSVQRAYARSDLLAKRWQLLDAWADYCLDLGTTKPQDSESRSG